MKKILKYTLLFSFALVTQNLFWQNLQFNQGVFTIVKVSLILSLFETILKPVIKFLMLPINFLTFGLFRLVIFTLGFYLAIFVLVDFQVLSIATLSQNFFGLTVPAINLRGFSVFLVTAISANILVSIFKFIVKSPKIKK
jgi:uncharacterized membrane protein YvlD (DUF360 family)